MSFSIVTVIHDSAADVERLLQSIATNTAHAAPEVIVVDSGSADDGLQSAADAGARTLRLDGNPGFGAANNAGVALASFDVTVLLNPDIVLLDDGLVRLAAAAHRADVLVAPRLLNPDRSVQRSAWRRPGTLRAVAEALVPGPLRREPSAGAIGWVLGAAVAARTPLLRSLGPFDPDTFLFYEDMDLCLRAHEHGATIELEPSVALVHTGGHATRPAFGGEAIALNTRRRREVIDVRLGPSALALDDLAMALTFGLRAWRPRDRAWLRALRAERRRG